MGNAGAKKDEPEAAAPKLNKGQSTIVVTDKDRAVLELKLVAGDIKKYQKGLGVSCDELMQRAKALVSASKSNESRALGLLRLRKYKMDQSVRLDAQLANVLRMIDEMEFAEINKEVFINLKAGTRALKAMNEALPLEEVERIMSECDDAVEAERQIADALGVGSLGFLDAADIERELAEFTGVAINPAPIALPPVPNTPILPLPVPADRPVVPATQEPQPQPQLEQRELAT